jgi:quercetin dioxygenase-like cupin family protein
VSPLDELLARLREETGGGYAWSNGPGDRYAAHSHAFEKVLYCVEGSITFFLEDEGGRVELRAGDRLLLPAGVRHSAQVGSAGCLCVEGHREARG